MEPFEGKFWDCVAQTGEDKVKIGNWVFQTIEAILIGVMSLCGTFAFTSSKLFASFQEFGGAHVASIAPYIPLIIGVLLFAVGVLLIMVKNKGRGFFTWLVVIFSLPSILSLDSVDLFRFLKLDRVSAQFTTSLNSTEIMVIGGVIVICYLLINFMSLLRKSRNTLSAQGADLSGTAHVYFVSHIVLLQIIVIALSIAALIMVSALGIEFLSHSTITRLPWNLFFVGLGCIILIAAYVYWLVSRRKGNI
jgi:hypothetical protein